MTPPSHTKASARTPRMAQTSRTVVALQREAIRNPRGPCGRGSPPRLVRALVAQTRSANARGPRRDADRRHISEEPTRLSNIRIPRRIARRCTGDEARPRHHRTEPPLPRLLASHALRERNAAEDDRRAVQGARRSTRAWLCPPPYSHHHGNILFHLESGPRETIKMARQR